jgi:hypothetical protein
VGSSWLMLTLMLMRLLRIMMLTVIATRLQ